MLTTALAKSTEMVGKLLERFDLALTWPPPPVWHVIRDRLTHPGSCDPPGQTACCGTGHVLVFQSRTTQPLVPGAGGSGGWPRSRWSPCNLGAAATALAAAGSVEGLREVRGGLCPASLTAGALDVPAHSSAGLLRAGLGAQNRPRTPAGKAP